MCDVCSFPESIKYHQMKHFKTFKQSNYLMAYLVQLQSFITTTLYYVCWDWNRKLGQSWVATEIAASASSYTLLWSSLLWKWTIGKVFHYRYIQNLRIGLFVKGPLQQDCQLCPILLKNELGKPVKIAILEWWWKFSVESFCFVKGHYFLIKFPKF